MSGVAIIGGTGLSRMPPEVVVEALNVETAFGRAAAARVRHEDREFVFLARHGETHNIAPHQVNYRANIAALAALGVTRVFATNAVGSLRLDLPPGALVLLDDFLDFTRGRPLSYWDGAPNAPAPVVHTDFSEPYCPELRDALIEAASNRDTPLLPRGVYLCADGPRYESPAEVRLFAQWGADVVGMTGLPEAVFAREAGLCYAAIAVVTNFGAGLTAQPIAHGNVSAGMRAYAEPVRELFLEAVRRLPETRVCGCGGA